MSRYKNYKLGIFIAVVICGIACAIQQNEYVYSIIGTIVVIILLFVCFCKKRIKANCKNNTNVES